MGPQVRYALPMPALDPLPHGIVPMQYAFFGPDGALDVGAFRRQVEACLCAGVQGIAILGLGS